MTIIQLYNNHRTNVMKMKTITIKVTKIKQILTIGLADNHISYTARGGHYPTHKDTYNMYSSNIRKQDINYNIIRNYHRTSLCRYKLLYLMHTRLKIGCYLFVWFESWRPKANLSQKWIRLKS